MECAEFRYFKPNNQGPARMEGRSVRAVRDVMISGSAVMVDPNVLTDTMKLMRLAKVRKFRHFDSLDLSIDG